MSSRWSKTRNTLRRLLGEEGANLVESAIAMVVFLPLLIGALEFSLVFYAYHDVTDAARVGARWAMVRGVKSCSNTPGLHNASGQAPYTCPSGATAADIRSYVQGLGYPGLVPTTLQVNVSWLKASAGQSPSTTNPNSWTVASTAAQGNQVQVNVEYDYPVAIGFWRATTIPLKSTATEIISQ